MSLQSIPTSLPISLSHVQNLSSRNSDPSERNSVGTPTPQKFCRNSFCRNSKVRTQIWCRLLLGSYHITNWRVVMVTCMEPVMWLIFVNWSRFQALDAKNYIAECSQMLRKEMCTPDGSLDLNLTYNYYLTSFHIIWIHSPIIVNNVTIMNFVNPQSTDGMALMMAVKYMTL